MCENVVCHSTKIQKTIGLYKIYNAKNGEKRLYMFFLGLKILFHLVHL